MRHVCNLTAKESGLECACVNNDALTVLVHGGWGKLEHASTETIWMVQKATAMDHW